MVQCEATSSDTGAYIDSSGACRACPSGCTSCRDGDGSCEEPQPTTRSKEGDDTQKADDSSEQTDDGTQKADAGTKKKEGDGNEGDGKEGDGKEGDGSKQCPERCTDCDSKGKCDECEDGWAVDDGACVQVRPGALRASVASACGPVGTVLIGSEAARAPHLQEGLKLLPPPDTNLDTFRRSQTLPPPQNKRHFLFPPAGAVWRALREVQAPQLWRHQVRAVRLWLRPHPWPLRGLLQPRLHPLPRGAGAVR